MNGDDVPLSPSGDFIEQTVREIALHRTNVLKEMIKEFQAWKFSSIA